MKVMDNSPIDVPALGTLVTEQYAVGQFVDCCFYVLPSNVDSVAEKAKNVFDNLFGKQQNKGVFLNKYDFEILETLPILDNHPKLNNAIKEEKGNLLLSLNTPYQLNKHYLVVHSEGNNLHDDFGLMLYASETITRRSMNEILRQYAVEDTSSFCSYLNQTVNPEKFWKTYVSQVLANVFLPVQGMFPTLPNLREVLDIEGVVTYKKKNEMIQRMEDNIKKLKKNQDPKAEAELSYVLNSLDVDSLLLIVSSLPKKQRELFCNAANPMKIAEESKIRLEVQKAEAKDKKFKTNGKYRLCLVKDSERQHVHFKYKESLIIYLIYLIDKSKREVVDSLDIKNYKGQFVALFNQVYNDEDAVSRFDDLVKHAKNGNPHQAQIKHCYSDIRISIGNVCEKMHELSSPFILKDAHDHLSVLKERITIHQDLLKLVS